MTDIRQQELQAWLSQQLNSMIELQPVIGDASFRRYFRMQHQGKTYVAMDAPPDKEDTFPFVAIAKAFYRLGLLVPEIVLEDVPRGFLLISDLGDQLYHRILNSSNVEQLYSAAINDLYALQVCPSIDEHPLPHFDWNMMRLELDNFTEWFMQKLLGFQLDDSEQATLEQTYSILLDSAISQPQTIVHRDYHSRNLMQLPNGKVGILDFQDAVIGPITYDLVSLIRDCYVDWPVEQVEAWAIKYYQQLMKLKRIEPVDQATFMHWFDLMGMQRHLKAIFIFARKYLRDNNDLYLQFIPRALNYIKYVSNKYPELQAFQHLFEKKILPAWEEVALPA